MDSHLRHLDHVLDQNPISISGLRVLEIWKASVSMQVQSVVIHTEGTIDQVSNGFIWFNEPY
jgi:hypothetical protein